MSFVSAVSLFLDKGSRGWAVGKLHQNLFAYGFGDGIDPKEIEEQLHGETSVAAVRKWQIEGLDFDPADADGNYGTRTRKREKSVYKYDINAIPACMTRGEKTIARYPQQDDPVIWPPEKEKPPRLAFDDCMTPEGGALRIGERKVEGE